MDGDGAGNEVGLRRKHVTVLPDPRDFAYALQFAQFVPESYSLVRFETELTGDFDFIERPIISVPH